LKKQIRRWRGFILFETMLAVTIFSLAVLALGKCVDNCMQAEILKEQDTRARRFLENRMAEIEAGAVPMDDKTTTTQLKDTFAGMTLKQSRAPLKRKNEKNQDIIGLYTVTLDLSWVTRGEKQGRTLAFYVFPKPN
jgi:Tfp pilus assembly protein PilV